MPKYSNTLLVACLASAIPACVIAANDMPLPGHSMIMPDRKPMTRDALIARTKAIFTKFDLNHDGVITLDEVKVACNAKMTEMKTHRFDELDTNHDGMISRDEFMAAHPHDGPKPWARSDAAQPNGAHHDGDMAEDKPRPGMRHGRWMMARHHDMRRLFTEADTNHDGKLTLDEVLTYRLAHFDKVDTNHDGIISPDEMKAFHDAKRAEWQMKASKESKAS